MGFFTESAESIDEMAVAKMPEGTKRVRSKTYASTHDIHVDGEHVATITGHSARWSSSGYRGMPAHAKIYHVHTNEGGIGSQTYHPDHSFETTERRPTHHPDTGPDYSKMHDVKVKRPHEYHSFDDAVASIVHTHRNNKEFGKGHDPRKRWEKALGHQEEHVAHQDKIVKYKHAIAAAHNAGHPEIADQLQKHHDNHVANAAGMGASKEKLHQWTHDAHRYTGHKQVKQPNGPNGEWGGYKTEHDYPEHHELASRAEELHRKTYSY